MCTIRRDLTTTTTTTPLPPPPPLFYSHYTPQPVLAGTLGQELGDFVGAKFYCPHAIADSN